MRILVVHELGRIIELWCKNIFAQRLKPMSYLQVISSVYTSLNVLPPVHTTSLQYPFWLSARIPLTQDLHFAISISYYVSRYFQYVSQLLKNTLWFFKVGNPTERPTKMCATSPESCVQNSISLKSKSCHFAKFLCI